MPEDRREALLAQAEALMASRGSIADPADRARLRDAMQAIQDEIDTIVLTDLNAAAAACGRAADAVQEVIDMIGQHAPQQIAQLVRDSLENLDRLRDPAVV